MVVGGGNLKNFLQQFLRICMIKVPIYIERRGLEITKKIVLTKFNYCESQLPSPEENLKES